MTSFITTRRLPAWTSSGVKNGGLPASFSHTHYSTYEVSFSKKDNKFQSRKPADGFQHVHDVTGNPIWRIAVSSAIYKVTHIRSSEHEVCKKGCRTWLHSRTNMCQHAQLDRFPMRINSFPSRNISGREIRIIRILDPICEAAKLLSCHTVHSPNCKIQGRNVKQSCGSFRH